MQHNWWQRARKKLPPLRNYTPRTLFGRSMLIIALPIALMQIAVVFTFFDRHWQSVSTSLSEGVVGDISMVLDLYSQNPAPERLQEVADLAIEKMNLSVALLPDETLPTSIRSSLFSPLDRTLRRAMVSKISRPFWFDTTRYPEYVDIQVQMDGDILRFVAPRERVYATTGHIFVAWLVGATFVLTGIAIIFTRTQLRPISELAKAAEQLGKGHDISKIKPTGALEVRQAAEAFLRMEERISRFVSQRTEMLAGVSHDLRTPLTRLKLQMALLGDSQELDGARSDIKDMEQMLEAYLDFARGEVEGDPVRFDLAKMIQKQVIKNVPKAKLRQIELSASIPVIGREQSIARVLTNLLENAVRYANNVWVRAKTEPGQARIFIEDDGPGIAKEDREAAFRPFNRLDEARNLNTEGVGLGLAISRDTARAHGGDVLLSRSSKGGLQVLLALPLATLEPDQDR